MDTQSDAVGSVSGLGIGSSAPRTIPKDRKGGGKKRANGFAGEAQQLPLLSPWRKKSWHVVQCPALRGRSPDARYFVFTSTSAQRTIMGAAIKLAGSS